MKRLCIFHMFDPDGIADDYIFYFLDALKENVSRIAVVCNGEMQPDSVERLNACADSVFVRENIGFDCGAFKDALTDLIGWDEVYKYDELVLVNDSCYGPIFPLDTVFDEMSKRDCDFWGITRAWELHTEVAQYPEHLQSYFLTIRSRMLKSPEFKRFWSEIGYPVSHMATVFQYELRFTEYFESFGYKSSSYVDCEFFRDIPKKNFGYIYFDSYRLIAERAYPFVKRKVFTSSNVEMLAYSHAETARKTLDFISTETEYPERLIWKHLIRTCDVNDLRVSLHLNYVFPSTVCVSKRVLHKKRIAVIAHIYYPDLIEKCFNYINNIPENIDVIITTSGEKNQEKIETLFKKSGRENYRVIVSKNRGREISALLVECRDLFMEYEYLCFVHDKKSSHMRYMSCGSSFMDLLWENSLKSDEYIENVLNCFEQNPCLGFLSPPRPYFGHALTGIYHSWLLGNYTEVLRLSERLKLHCIISEQRQPIFALGTVFWCRTAALKTLFEYGFKYEDFHEEPMPVDATISHAIERIFPYVAQHEGYYSGVMMTDEYASLYAVNYEHIIDTVISSKKSEKDNNPWFFTDFNFDHEPFADFCRKHKKIYIYGAGGFAVRFMYHIGDEIHEFMGYIVSDGRKIENNWFTSQIYELSEITPCDDEGIIIALNDTNKREVIPELKRRGFKNVI